MIVVIKKENGDKEDAYSKLSDYPHNKDLTLKKSLEYKENTEKLLSKSLLQNLGPVKFNLQSNSNSKSILFFFNFNSNSDC